MLDKGAREMCHSLISCTHVRCTANCRVLKPPDLCANAHSYKNINAREMGYSLSFCYFKVLVLFFSLPFYVSRRFIFSYIIFFVLWRLCHSY